jgi:UDP-N-acetylmuramoyl-L-alanyl-D-glutamate--2,6-diaminopimelate ligase
MFDEMVRSGVDSVAMEVTSHGLTQHRVAGCQFHAAAFTNMSREHLDFHADMEEYFQSKKTLFRDYGVGQRAAFNLECEWALRARRESTEQGIGFGLAPGADVTARDPSITREGIRADLITPSGTVPIASPLMGRINLMNILCASSLAWLMQVPLPAIAQGIASVSGVPGRLQEVGRAFGRRVIVDYSHKVDSMVRVFAIARTFTPGRLIIVFGCGGDRDRGKRPLMGRAAAEGGDVVIVTSDNPRSEDPAEIMRQIETGFVDTSIERLDGSQDRIPQGRGFYTIIEDRRAAIRLAVRSAGRDDTVLICGKGHETYQIVGDVVRHFDDREEAVQALQDYASG